MLGAPARPAALDTLLTHTRISPAWGYGPDGNLSRYEAGVPRYVSDPVAPSPRGVLLESASANLALWSNDFTKPVYAVAGLTFFPFAVQGIAGRNTGTRVVDGSSIGTLAQTTATGGGFSSGGIFVRPVTGATQFRLRATLNGGSSAAAGNATFDLSTGAFLGATGVAGRCRPGPGGFYRIEVSIANAVGATSLTLQLERANAGDTGVSYDIAEMQIENRIPLSSPMPTTSTITTRAADRMSMSIGPWWVPIEGTITAEFIPQGDPVGTSQQVLALRNDAGNAFINLYRSQFGPAVVLSGSGGANVVMYGADNDVFRRVSCRVRGNDYAGAMGNSSYLDAGVATSTGTVPAGLTTLDIGHINGGSVLDGVLRRVLIETIGQGNTALSDRVR